MKFCYKLERLCGEVHNNGNLLYSRDGESLLSAIGNRVNVYDLVRHSTNTLGFENKKDIAYMALSHNGIFLVAVDVDGHALFINFPRQVILQRFHFKRSITQLKFSPDDKYFAVTFGKGCQIWRSPSIEREFCPLVLSRNITGFSDEVTCLEWSTDSQSLILGSRDLSAKIYFKVHSKKMAMTTLTGHRDFIVGCSFSYDGQFAYTVARDGAIFCWEFEEQDTNLGNEIDENADHDRDSSSGDEGDDSDEDVENVDDLKTYKKNPSQRKKRLLERRGHWKLHSRKFLWEQRSEVTSVCFHEGLLSTANPNSHPLLLIGFEQGVFGLYQLPSCDNLHRLSISTGSISSVTISPTGEWLALGCASLGSLVVWEWTSQSFIFKQQSHRYGLNTLSYSPEGSWIATGGEDGVIKLWSTATGFCQVTLNHHLAPVTGLQWVGGGVQGNYRTGASGGLVLLSSSLDGTVRAVDMKRYRNFRTLVPPGPGDSKCPLTCLAADPSGDIVCAGAWDPFHIFVWTLSTGQLLDVLAGHEGPLACLAWSPVTSSSQKSTPASSMQLASGSWDGTLKLWNIFGEESGETMEHGCDVLAIAFRPDGKEICTATVHGLLHRWDVESGLEVGRIEGQADLQGGRLTTEAVSAKKSRRSMGFTSVSYSSDGLFLLAGGRSPFVCLYSIAGNSLVKKFQLSHNRSLEGAVDILRSDRLVDGISLDNLPTLAMSSSYSSKNTSELMKSQATSRLNEVSRTVRPEIRTQALGFSPTGREWAVATSHGGLQVFSLDQGQLFAPLEWDIELTPAFLRQQLQLQHFGKALQGALQLGDPSLLQEVVLSIPLDAIALVVKSIPLILLEPFLKYLAQQMVSSRHIEFYLQWCWHVLCCHGSALQMDSMPFMESLRSLIRALNMHEKDVLKMSDENQFRLQFLQQQKMTVDVMDNDKEHLDLDGKIDD